MGCRAIPTGVDVRRANAAWPQTREGQKLPPASSTSGEGDGGGPPYGPWQSKSDGPPQVSRGGRHGSPLERDHDAWNPSQTYSPSCESPWSELVHLSYSQWAGESTRPRSLWADWCGRCQNPPAPAGARLGGPLFHLRITPSQVRPQALGSQVGPGQSPDRGVQTGW